MPSHAPAYYRCYGHGRLGRGGGEIHDHVPSANVEYLPAVGFVVLACTPHLLPFVLPAPCHRSFDHGPLHVVVLDGNVGVSDFATEVQWLQRGMAALALRQPGTLQWLVAVVHHAPYSKGSEDSDVHDDQRCAAVPHYAPLSSMHVWYTAASKDKLSLFHAERRAPDVAAHVSGS